MTTYIYVKNSKIYVKDYRSVAEHTHFRCLFDVVGFLNFSGIDTYVFFTKIPIRKASKSIALTSCLCSLVWLPIPIYLDLSESFAMFGLLSSCFSVVMLLIRGYSFKYTYITPKVFHIYSTMVLLLFIFCKNLLVLLYIFDKTVRNDILDF